MEKPKEVNTTDWKVKYLLIMGFISEMAMKNLTRECKTEADYKEMFKINDYLAEVRDKMIELGKTNVLRGEEIDTYLGR